MKNLISATALVAWSGCVLAQTTGLGTPGPYVVAKLETLGAMNAAEAINNSGQVAGFVSMQPGTTTATVWNGTTPTLLNTLPGGNSSEAYGINNAGQIVGCASDGRTFAATVWNGTSPTALDVSSDGSCALGINDAGTAVGWTIFTPDQFAIVWNGTDLLGLGGPFSAATAINNVGQIVGYSEVTTESRVHAVLWNDLNVTDLGTLGGDDNSEAYAINTRGQIVGVSGSYGFLFENGTMTALNPPSGTGGVGTWANGIDDAGDIVGYTLIPVLPGGAQDVATLWHGTTALDLNTLIGSALPPGTLAVGVAISDNGRILAASNESYYVLTPVPDALTTLLKEVTGVGPGRSLADHVTLAQTDYAVPDIQSTCAVLTGFVNEVQAQAGKKIAQPLDMTLLADAQAIEAAIGCN